MMTLVLGIDVGTQGGRALVCDLTGRVQADASVALPLTTLQASQQGWFEQDPASWLRATVAVVRSVMDQLAQRAVPADAVQALSVTSTSGTMCLVDEVGTPVRPAIMYSDTRSSGPTAQRVQAAGQEVAAKLGIGYSASYALTKLAWVQEHEPQQLAQARWYLSPTDLVIGWLTGAWGHTDWTNALKWGYDVVDLRWPAFIAAKLGLEEIKFPQVHAPGTPLGHVSAQAASRTGLAITTRVVAGSTDGTASQLASGAVVPGDWNSTLGTTLVLKGVTEQLLRDPQGRIYSHRHPDGHWLPGAASSAGADALALHFAADQLEALNASALAVSPTTLTVYPLARRGERFPFARPDATGFTLGQPSSPSELYAAHLEGLAYLEKLCFAVLADLGAQVGECLHVAGGATRSQAGLQIRADVLAKSLQVPKVPEGAMGAAILAARSCGFATVAEAAHAMVHYAQVVEPRPGMAEAYDPGYERFLTACRERGYLA
jgi:xylulokinase